MASLLPKARAQLVLGLELIAPSAIQPIQLSSYPAIRLSRYPAIQLFSHPAIGQHSQAQPQASHLCPGLSVPSRYGQDSPGAEGACKGSPDVPSTRVYSQPPCLSLASGSRSSILIEGAGGRLDSQGPGSSPAWVLIRLRSLQPCPPWAGSRGQCGCVAEAARVDEEVSKCPGFSWAPSLFWAHPQSLTSSLPQNHGGGVMGRLVVSSL